MPTANPNGKKPTPPKSLHFERSQVECQRCGRPFEHFMLEEIDDLAQLRCGDVVLPHAKMICLHCGWVFYWDVTEKKLSEMVVAYGELLVLIKREELGGL